MKVSELTGALLNYWVAKTLGRGGIMYKKPSYVGDRHYVAIDGLNHDWAPSTDWSQGGPIIERERIFSRFVEKGFLPMLFENKWVCHYKNGSEVSGDTQLIAAMRCYVASKYGEEVPDE